MVKNKQSFYQFMHRTYPNTRYCAVVLPGNQPTRCWLLTEPLQHQKATELRQTTILHEGRRYYLVALAEPYGPTDEQLYNIQRIVAEQPYKHNWPTTFDIDPAAFVAKAGSLTARTKATQTAMHNNLPIWSVSTSKQAAQTMREWIATYLHPTADAANHMPELVLSLPDISLDSTPSPSVLTQNGYRLSPTWQHFTSTTKCVVARCYEETDVLSEPWDPNSQIGLLIHKTLAASRPVEPKTVKVYDYETSDYVYEEVPQFEHLFFCTKLQQPDDDTQSVLEQLVQYMFNPDSPIPSSLFPLTTEHIVLDDNKTQSLLDFTIDMLKAGVAYSEIQRIIFEKRAQGLIVKSDVTNEQKEDGQELSV